MLFQPFPDPWWWLTLASWLPANILDVGHLNKSKLWAGIWPDSPVTALPYYGLWVTCLILTSDFSSMLSFWEAMEMVPKTGSLIPTGRRVLHCLSPASFWHSPVPAMWALGEVNQWEILHFCLPVSQPNKTKS